MAVRPGSENAQRRIASGRRDRATPFEARLNPDKCTDCGACRTFVACPGAREQICIGCGACVQLCPNEALELVEVRREREVSIEVNGTWGKVPERITVKEALWHLGHEITAGLPAEGALYAPCGVGACWNCAVEIDGAVRRACVTEAKEGMRIKTEVPDTWVPLRIVGPSGGLPYGGVGTPWEVRKNATSEYLEICCLTAGCNFRCPQCHNWMITHMSDGLAYTAREAATKLTGIRHKLNVDRFCLSGGEITLNRRWLIQLVQELKRLNPEPETRLHISTNASLLTQDYIDELIDAGLTDFGIDLKGLDIDTFMKVTGLKNKELAERCKETAWNAVDYIAHRYRDRVFLGVGIPYNKELTTMEEMQRAGRKLCSIDPSIQTTAMAYFSGEYRSDIEWPTQEEMEAVHRLLEETGLTTVQCFAIKFIPPSQG